MTDFDNGDRQCAVIHLKNNPVIPLPQPEITIIPLEHLRTRRTSILRKGFYFLQNLDKERFWNFTKLFFSASFKNS